MWESIRSEAIKYAARGWYVVPDHSVLEDGRCTCLDPECKVQGKHPRIERDSPYAPLRRIGSIDRRQVESWWNEWPQSNIAICCGRLSDIIAIDIDPRNGGLVSLARLKLKYGNFADTLTSKTGGGGMHILFRHPKVLAVRNRIGLMPGIDVKADEGRIVAPPSRHKSGRTYEWLSDPYTTQLKFIPFWLLDMIQNQKGTGTKSAMTGAIRGRERKNAR